MQLTEPPMKVLAVLLLVPPPMTAAKMPSWRFAERTDAKSR